MGRRSGKEDVEVELELGLDEDVDMRGWLSLRGLMGRAVSVAAELAPIFIFVLSYRWDKDKSVARRMVALREKVHPNVEQLMRIADLLKDARRVVGLEGSPLVLYGGQFVVKGVEAAKPAAGVSHVPPRVAVDAHHQDALALIRARALRDDLDLDDDAMMEQTSVTDDDILHDAFSFLNRTGSESKAAEASDEDEIIDAPVSPIVPTARMSPKTPAVSQPKQLITTGTQVSSTTALDLLNTFAKKPVAVLTPPAGGAGAAGMGVGTPDGMLFGSRAALQSIWSASRDERGLMFAGGGGASGGGVGQQQQQRQLAHQHAHAPQHLHGAHHRFASQDFASSQGSTIWASSYPSTNQHQVPPAGFGHPPPTHQRVVSNSMAVAQLFPSGGDQYGYDSLSAPPPQGSRRSHKDTDLGKRMDVTRRRGMDTGSMRDTYRSIRAQLPSIAMGSPCRNC
ncbi:hypothetical protein B0H14DRAFT_3478888 [Mycena olivaceomarginata]|nr:hypothetical protein B0H14DRAFT_3478888 [Mycena olivaceomarginata]